MRKCGNENSTVAKKIVEDVIAREQKGWFIVPDSIRVSGDTATVRITSGPLTIAVGVSLSKKRIEWSQG